MEGFQHAFFVRAAVQLSKTLIAEVFPESGDYANHFPFG